MKTLPKADVLLIGIGAAGGIASYVLTKAGLSVVALEAGPRLSNAEFAKQLDEVGGYEARNVLGAPKVNHEIPTWRPRASMPVQHLKPPYAILMANLVGGTSVHFGAQFWRFHESDFKVRTYTVERYGTKALPAGSALADWPVSHADMEPYYDQVEYLIGVSGRGGSNPFEAPRSRDYPLPPVRSMGSAELATKAMRELGYHPFPQPAAVLSRRFNGRPACTFCDFCDGFGCWNNSKSSTLVSAIPAAEKTGKLEIRPNSRVMRILTDSAGNASGVEYLDSNGQTVTQPAAFVILSTYTYENTRLLLVSRTSMFPNGLANNHGQVGKYYMAHYYPSANGIFPGKATNMFSGTASQGVAMDDLNADNFDHAGLGFIRGAEIGVSNEVRPIGAAANVPPDVPMWGAAYKQWLRQYGNSIITVSGQLENIPSVHNFLDLDPTKKDPLGMPVVRVTYDLHENEMRAGNYMLKKATEILKAMGATKTWYYPPSPLAINSHAYGGTRTGEDPATSVVDPYLITHEVRNLAVLGASTFPSTTGFNPTCTVEATAWFAAEHIAKNFHKLAV
ncbi:MAG: rane-bound D-gluconate 2-dehydrogenase large subunit [Chloroflexi bacterium]|nr:rane-bound D-gluconate 2-dehydrogenase large subunit [Chloroflexota bacterium]